MNTINEVISDVTLAGENNGFTHFACRESSLEKKLTAACRQISVLVKAGIIDGDANSFNLTNMKPQVGAMFDTINFVDMNGNDVAQVIPWLGYGDNFKGAAYAIAGEEQFTEFASWGAMKKHLKDNNITFGIVPVKEETKPSKKKTSEDKAPGEETVDVNEMISNLIMNENIREPLSDKKIAEMITESGHKISATTVAKRRKDMGIASSTDRKLQELDAA